MKKLKVNGQSDMVAVFNSPLVFPDVALSHNVVYVKIGSQAASDVELADMFLEKVTIDSAKRKLLFGQELYDIVNVKQIYPEYSDEAARMGGVVAGDVVIDKDTVIENGLVICGSLIVNPDVKLVIRKEKAVIAENAVIGGQLLFDAPDYGFKPGHVVGPDANLKPGKVYVCGHTDFTVSGAGVGGTGAWFYTGSAIIYKDSSFSGMIFYDDLIVKEGATLTAKDGCWINWIHATLEDHVTFCVSETEICVLEYIHHDKSRGYYDHTGYGTTNIGSDVKLVGDDTFCWFWMGDMRGRFADVRGNIVMKGKQVIQVNECDLRNFEISEINGNGTEADPYTLTYHEKDPGYCYITSRKLAMDAAVNNVIQDRFPEYVLFDYWNKRVLGFKDLRAGNILIHRVDDIDTLIAFADLVVYANEI